MQALPHTITTVDIAKMLEMRHADILTRLEGNKRSKGIIKILTEREIPLSDFFQESTYKDDSGKENKCYKVTKLGCDFLANKFQGEKGIVFTALYVKRFADMEQELTKQPALPQKQQPLLLKDSKTWFSQNNWKLKYICDEMGWKRSYLYHKILQELSEFYSLRCFEDMYISKHGYKPRYKMDLLEEFALLADTATNYIDYLVHEIEEQ